MKNIWDTQKGLEPLKPHLNTVMDKSCFTSLLVILLYVVKLVEVFTTSEKS